MAKEEKREKRKQQQRECGAVKDVLVLNDFSLLRIGMDSTI